MRAGAEQRRASDILYDDIFASKNSVRRANIRIIKSVCDQMEKDKVVITAAEVARRGGESGPAYSTISNTGSRLGEYIKLRIVEQASMRPAAPGMERGLADAITDPVLAAQIRDKESSARWFQKENAALRYLLKTLAPSFDIDAALSRATKGQSVPLFEPRERQSKGTNDELAGVLLKLMDHLVRDRQYVELRGRLAINRKVVLEPREYQAYREGCGMTQDAWRQRYGEGE